MTKDKKKPEIAKAKLPTNNLKQVFKAGGKVAKAAKTAKKPVKKCL